MSGRIRIAVDAMGGDYAPGEIVRGVMDALKEQPDIHVLLVGAENAIRSELKRYTYREDQVSIVPASEVIEMAEEPVAAIRKKKDSSIVVGLRLVRDGEADAFLSGGNSGAVMAGGQLITGRIRGIERAPFAALVPTETGVCLILDCGANVDSRPSQLVQFAQMGNIYMRDVVGIREPRVAILNIGAEEEKGNHLVKETFPLLRELRDIRFIGSCEARDVPAGYCDVLVCEGFCGNIMLKLYEGTASMLFSVIKEGLMSSLRAKIGAFLIKPALKKILKTYNADRYGGAPVLGLKGLVVKIHGNAKAVVVRNAVLQCVRFKEADIAEKIRQSIAAESSRPNNDIKGE